MSKQPEFTESTWDLMRSVLREGGADKRLAQQVERTFWGRVARALRRGTHPTKDGVMIDESAAKLYKNTKTVFDALRSSDRSLEVNGLLTLYGVQTEHQQNLGQRVIAFFRAVGRKR